MLVLSRKENESVVIDGEITVRVLSVKGSRVRLGFDAPASVAITRDELVVDLQEVSTPNFLTGVVQTQLCEQA